MDRIDRVRKAHAFRLPVFILFILSIDVQSGTSERKAAHAEHQSTGETQREEVNMDRQD